MLNVYLLRHGQTEWNADGNRYCGRTDIRLTQTGIQQAQRVRDQLANVIFDGIYSSPLMRAYETAKVASGGRIVTCDPRLIEADFGKWEGKTKEQFIAEDPGPWKSWQENPMITKAGATGETAADIVGRVDEFFRDMLAKHHGHNILVVGHNGINRIYLAYKLGMDVKHYRRIVQENSSVTLFSLDDDAALTLKLLNGNGIIGSV